MKMEMEMEMVMEMEVTMVKVMETVWVGGRLPCTRGSASASSPHTLSTRPRPRPRALQALLGGRSMLLTRAAIRATDTFAVTAL